MINYVTGDATDPKVEGRKIIAHVCNDVGGWGRGFVLSVSRRWPEPERMYRAWHQKDPTTSPTSAPFELGQIQLVPVDRDVRVANMIAQHDVVTVDGVPPIRYDALEQCLRKLRTVAKILGASVHMPRIGCGLAGGNWSEVEALIEQNLTGVQVYVYDFDTGAGRTVRWQP